MLSWTQVHFLPDSSGFSLLDLLAPHLGSGGGGGRMSGLISRQYKHLVRACLASFGRTKVVSDICCCISMFTTSFDAAEMLRLGRPSFINYKKVLPGLWPLVSGLWPDPAILASGAAAVAPAPSASARSDQIPIHPFVVVVVDVVMFFVYVVFVFWCLCLSNIPEFDFAAKALASHLSIFCCFK
mmetsp:Transcript_69709/g.145667  ORF Transcript_69709/g.145667 Transcript_69709/m.145667 type:complete len:184 (-) Transcript_69709:110-661(-)